MLEKGAAESGGSRVTDREILDFLHIAEHLKDNTRHCCTSKGRPESVAEHSWRVALLAMLLEDELADADFGKVVRMCILHDLGEAITGDIPSFWKTKADSDHEDDVIYALLDTLPEPQRSRFRALFEEMHAQQSREAKIYKALDKIEACVQHNESPLSTWLPLEYELNQTYGQENAAFDPRLKQLRETVAEDTREKIARGE